MQTETEEQIRIYGGYAQGEKDGETVTRPLVVCARSIEEALGKAILFCRSDFPEKVGWRNCYADVVEMTKVKIIWESLNAD